MWEKKIMIWLVFWFQNPLCGLGGKGRSCERSASVSETPRREVALCDCGCLKGHWMMAAKSD